VPSAACLLDFHCPSDVAQRSKQWCSISTVPRMLPTQQCCSDFVRPLALVCPSDVPTAACLLGLDCPSDVPKAACLLGFDCPSDVANAAGPPGFRSSTRFGLIPGMFLTRHACSESTVPRTLPVQRRSPNFFRPLGLDGLSDVASVSFAPRIVGAGVPSPPPPPETAFAPFGCAPLSRA
jgi:hypothetical protein